MDISIQEVMQVIAWLGVAVGLILTVRTSARTGQKDQVMLENRLTKIESTLDNINDAIVKGQLIADVADLKNWKRTVEERGCGYAEHCGIMRGN